MESLWQLLLNCGKFWVRKVFECFRLVTHFVVRSQRDQRADADAEGEEDLTARIAPDRRRCQALQLRRDVPQNSSPASLQ